MSKRGKRKKEKKKSYVNYFYQESGVIPGTLRIPEGARPVEINLIDYNQTDYERKDLISPEECIPFVDKNSVSWFDIHGLGSEEILRKLGDIFKLHPLVLEDVVNIPQRAKFEDYESQILIILHMISLKDKNSLEFVPEQVSFILGKSYLLTFQEEPEVDSFEEIRDRIKFAKGTIRKRGSSYLAYSLIDSVIDGFYPVLEVYGEELEKVEEEAIEKPTKKTIKKIHFLKRRLIEIKRLVWPVRDALHSLIREEHHLIGKDVEIYLKDCYDHSVQVLDVVENYRDLTYSLMDVYMSSVGNKMNDIMKILTIISTVFIPLTFIAGVYGMNFNPDASPFNMPEINWYWGYPAIWTAMILIGSLLTFLFWLKGWFKDTSGLEDE